MAPPSVALSRGDLAFLETQRVARFATLPPSPDRAPHLIPVCFVHVDGRLYVPIDAKPKRVDPHDLTRLRNLRVNPRATFLVDHYAEDWTHLRWLLIRVHARILEAGDNPASSAERASALTALERRYPQYAAMRLSTLNFPVIALDPTSIRRWSASAPTS